MAVNHRISWQVCRTVLRHGLRHWGMQLAVIAPLVLPPASASAQSANVGLRTQLSAAQEERVQDLERDLARARAANQDAEVREIRALREKLRRVPEDPAATLAAPNGLRALGSYGRNALIWHRAEGSEDAVEIERQVGAEGEWQTVTPSPIQGDRWFDDDVIPGQLYQYRAHRLRDARPSEPTPVQAARPRDPRDASLLSYSLTLPESGRRAMLADPRSDVEVAGVFAFQGRSHPVSVRLHGASTRQAAKKSYRIEFLDDSPLDRPVTCLKGEPLDHTMQQEKLTCDVWQDVGAWVSRAHYVNLFINGRYEGIYVDIEPIRAAFKRNPGLDPHGTLIRAATFQQLEGWDGLGELRGTRGSLTELREFIRQINRVERGDFATWTRTVTDWARVCDYMALTVICHRSEIEADDYFFYQDPVSRKWSFIPWDHNNGNFGVAGYENRIVEPSVQVFPQTIQNIGWRLPWWFVLPSRVAQDDGLRREYLDRLEQLTKGWLLSGKVDAMIDGNFAQLRHDFPVDPYRVPYEGEDPFLRSPQELKDFVRHLAHHILRQIQRERARADASVVINEFAFDPQAGWVELHNRGATSVSLADYRLVVKDATGNWELPLSAGEFLPPDGYCVIRCPRPSEVSAMSDPQRNNDAAARALRSDAVRAGPFPGFNPDGGFFALLQHPRGTAGEDGGELLDFWLYGPRPQGRSYGRFGDDFAELAPTPGSANHRPRLP